MISRRVRFPAPCDLLFHGRTAWGADWFWLHEFDSGEVVVVEVELPLAVAADLRLLFGVEAASLKNLVAVTNAGDAEGEVMHHA